VTKEYPCEGGTAKPSSYFYQNIKMLLAWGSILSKKWEQGLLTAEDATSQTIISYTLVHNVILKKQNATDVINLF
jgi:hypothetical protein